MPLIGRHPIDDSPFAAGLPRSECRQRDCEREAAQPRQHLHERKATGTFARSRSQGIGQGTFSFEIESVEDSNNSLGRFPIGKVVTFEHLELDKKRTLHFENVAASNEQVASLASF